MAQPGSISVTLVKALTVSGKKNECSIPSARSNSFCASGVHEVLNSTLPSFSPLGVLGEAASSWWASALVTQTPAMRLTASIRRCNFIVALHSWMIMDGPHPTLQRGRCQLFFPGQYSEDRRIPCSCAVWPVVLRRRNMSPEHHQARSIYHNLSHSTELRGKARVFHHTLGISSHSRMVKKLEPGLTGEVTIQPLLAPRLDFSCAMPHIHRQCASNSGGRQTHGLEDLAGVHHRDGRSRAAAA